MIHIMNDHIDTILILIGIIVTLVCFIVTWIRQKHLCRMMDQFSLLLYQMHRTFSQMHDEIYEIDQQTKQLHESFELISTSSKQRQPEKYAPTPAQAEAIEATIKDLFSIELILSSDMRTSRRESVTTIIMNTIETYPEIDETYIIKKTLSIVEAFIKEN